MGIMDGIIRIFTRQEDKAGAKPEKPAVAAVVVAAGSSTRMGVPKQLIPLRGIPVIGRTLLALEESKTVDEIILVTREEDMLQFYDICKAYSITKATKILKGGATRQESVARGVRVAKDDTAYFSIHDGARPLVTPAVIDRVVEAAMACGAATAAVRVKDTIKQSDENGFIIGTPDRQRLWQVQTPQVFERKLYLQALRQAEQEGADYTDDCQLVEHVGHPVMLCEADYANIKITTPEDVAYAEGILRGMGMDLDTGFDGLQD